MSLETRYRTEIRIPRTELVSSEANIRDTPCFEILRLAMEKVARDRGGVIDDTYTDNEGTRKDCLVAVRTGDFERGVGTTIEEDGTLSFVWDAYGDAKKIGQEIADEITQNYAVIAVMRVQRQHGFQVEVEEGRTLNRKKKVRVKGVL